MQLIWQRNRPSIPFLSVLFIVAWLPLNSIFGKYNKSFSSGVGEGLEGGGLTHMTLKQFVSARPWACGIGLFRMSFGGISRGRSCARREESETVKIPTAFALCGFDGSSPGRANVLFLCLCPRLANLALRPRPWATGHYDDEDVDDDRLGIRARAVKTKRPLC